MGIEIIIILLVLSVALSATSLLLAPKNDVEDAVPSGLGEYNFPTSLESRYLPVVYGTTELRAPNVIWYGDLRTWAIDTAGSVVGHRYYIGFDLALCHGTLDAISALRIDDTYLFQQGEGLGPSPDSADIGASSLPFGGYRGTTGAGFTNVYVNQPNFFGGQKNGGGVVGNLHLYFGNDTQDPDPYLRAKEQQHDYILDPGADLEDESDDITVTQDQLVPGYPGLARSVWAGGEFGERPTIAKWTFTVHRYPSQLTSSWQVVNYDAHTGHGDANPIHCLYEILTDTDYGLSIDPNDIDIQSFLDAAETCYYEGNGFGYTVDTTKTANTIIKLISDQIAGQLTQDQKGRFKVVLHRPNFGRTVDGSGIRELQDYTGAPIPSAISSTVIEHQADIFVTDDDADSIIDEILVLSNAGALYTGIEPEDWVYLRGVNFYEGPYEVSWVADTNDSFIVQTRPGRGEDAVEMLDVDISIDTIQGSEEYPLFTESDILEVGSVAKQSWDETFNTIQLKYVDRDDDFKETVATAHDMGNLAIQNGDQSIKKLDYQGIRNRNTAATVAQRELRNLSFPLVAVSLTLPRRASSLRPGDVIAVSHPDFGIGTADTPMVIRVLEVGLPGPVKGDVEVRGAQDMFSAPQVDEIVHVGGATDLRVQINARPDPVVDFHSMGMPPWLSAYVRRTWPAEFLNAQANSFRAWHVVGNPGLRSTSVESYTQDNGTFVSYTGQNFLRNRLTIKNPDDWRFELPAVNIWKIGDIDPATWPARYFDPSDATDPWTREPVAGKMTYPLDPMYLHATSNVDTDYPGNEYRAENGMRAINPYNGGDWQWYLPPILLDGFDEAIRPINEQVEEVIRNRGAGLVMAVPDPSDPDTFEFIAYESIDRFFIRAYSYRKDDGVFFGLRDPVYEIRKEDASEALDTVEWTLLSEIPAVALGGIHRGLLDSGIHQLPWGTELYFLMEDHPAYDQIDFDLSGSQTYYHRARGVGGETNLNTSTPSSVVTAEEVQRPTFPTVPKAIKVATFSAGTGSVDHWDTFGSLWFNTGNYRPDVYDLGAESSADIAWEWHDSNQESGGDTVNYPQPDMLFYDEVRSGPGPAVGLTQVVATCHLIPNGHASTDNERQEDAWAYWRAELLPSNPRKDIDQVTTYPLVASTTQSSGFGANQMFLNMNTVRSDFSLGVGSTSRYMIVELQAFKSDNPAGTQWSRKARFMVKFDADLADDLSP